MSFAFIISVIKQPQHLKLASRARFHDPSGNFRFAYEACASPLNLFDYSATCETRRLRRSFSILAVSTQLIVRATLPRLLLNSLIVSTYFVFTLVHTYMRLQ